jgi:peptidoglycan/LPS O-acetylase OafA/YrhL
MGLIRFLFACGVILVHTGGYVPINGNMGVQCFYIMSGFYMSLILNEKYKGQGSNIRFYKYRALKIFPIYWVTLILSVAWGIFVYLLGYPGTINQYAQHWPLPLSSLCFFIFSNLFLLGLDSVFFMGMNKKGGLYPSTDFNSSEPRVYTFAFNSIAWTIGVELLFYIIAPFILRKKLAWLIGILLLSLSLRLLLMAKGYTGLQWNYMFFPTQLMFFMAGCISYRLFNVIRNKNIPVLLALSLFGVYAVLVIGYNWMIPEGLIKETLLFVCTVLIIPIAFGISVKTKMDRYLGELSYSIYISQALIITLLASNHIPKLFSKGFTAILLCILFAILAHKFITLPISKWNRGRINKTMANHWQPELQQVHGKAFQAEIPVLTEQN